MPNVVIIGSGPTGFYVAEALQRKWPHAKIDILDRLPTPYGLVRAGVAPDHQGTKNIVRQFERTLAKSTVRFLGNVCVGRDVSYDELKAWYDVVVVAIGALQDRPLGITGDDLPQVYGSGAFVGWYNAHPDYQDLAPDLRGGKIAVIGNGNVALDLVRILAKNTAEMNQSDIAQAAADVITQAPITDIWLLGRRGPVEASFTSAELAELGALARATPRLDATQLSVTVPVAGDEKVQKLKQKNLEILQQLAAVPDANKPIQVHVRFYTAPVAVLADESGRVCGLQVAKTTLDAAGNVHVSQDSEILPVSAVISAIGYRSVPFEGLPFDARRGVVAHVDGRVESGVYTAGWCKRGPNGVVPANRGDALAVAELITNDMANVSATDKPGAIALDACLAARGVRVVDFQAWQRINQAEVTRASAGKPREKFTRVADMLALLDA